MKSRRVMMMVLGTFLGLGAIASVGLAKGGAKKPELSALSDAHWNPLMKGSPLPAIAPIEGDPMSGAFMGYLKLPAGFESPAHTHSNDYWAVLVQGKMTHWAVDGGSEQTAKQLGVGDLTHMPAHVAHVTKCFPGEDCVMVVTAKGKFDFIPTAAAKK
ncbi:MAG: hypothetical protein QOI66_524 [Myxococcales bacterium]|jgi:quercetin dioxygenase-like cupin family protein|nr:hypothetical protein [Myxococcales bacterium]